jgi:hypothetical protein
MEKIIFFGCWNNINCEKTYLHRDIILDHIKNNESDVHDLYLAGDNWYNNIIKISEELQFKYYLKTVLYSGYDKIYELKKNTYIGLGNHDIDYVEKDKETCLYDTQKNYIKEKNKKLNKKFIIYDDIGVINRKTYILLIINTNKINEDKYLENVKTNITKNASNKINKQLFVLGHHPLFSYKKDDEAIKKCKEINDEKLNNFFDILADNKCIYLCADTHNFGIMKISKYDKHIIQIISGTGGADPDIISNINKKMIREVTVNKIIYNLENYSINAYGYTKIMIADNDIIAEYNKIEINNENEKVINQYYFTINRKDREVYFSNTELLNYENYLSKNNKICKVYFDYETDVAKINNDICYKKKKKEKKEEKKEENIRESKYMIMRRSKSLSLEHHPVTI